MIRASLQGRVVAFYDAGFTTQIVALMLAVTPLARNVAGQERITTIRADHAIEAASVYVSAPLTEPFVLVDPLDPVHILVATIVAPVDDDSPWHCAALASFDGGERWTRTDFPMERCIDPWLAMAPDGDVLFVGIELLRNVEGDDRFHLVSFRSGDGGRTWSSEPRSLGRAHEHAMLWVDPFSRCRGDGCVVDPQSNLPYSGTVYLTSRRMCRTVAGQPRHKIYVARSDDNGRSFVDAAELAPSNLALTVTGIVSQGQNDLFISFWDFQRNVDGFGREGLLNSSRAWLYNSQDDGHTFDEPRLVTEECASGIEGSFPGYPFLVADTTNGPFRGRLYHACVRPGFDGISVTNSADNGEVWSKPMRVDAQLCSDGDACAPSDTRTAMLAVNRDGMVAIAWYDRSNHPEGRCQDVYFTVSTDGGDSVLRPLRISTESSCNDTPGNGRSGRSWSIGGDYSSIAAAPDGRFHVVWADSRSGRFQLRHAVLELTQ